MTTDIAAGTTESGVAPAGGVRWACPHCGRVATVWAAPSEGDDLHPSRHGLPCVRVGGHVWIRRVEVEPLRPRPPRT